jgi:hypothetical protein
MLNAFQLIVLVFALLSVGTCLAAIWMVIKCPNLRLKWLWIVGSLIGFVGFGINWTVPDDIILKFGFSILPIGVFRVPANGYIVVDALFPIVALLAILKVTAFEQSDAETFD